jgi:hypothetical protein
MPMPGSVATMEERDAITETAVSPELLAKAVQAVLRLEPAQAVTLRGRAEAILDMLIDEGVVEGIVETGIAIQARLDAYVELMSCPAMAEFHPARGLVSEECVLRAISQAPLRLREGRYRFCMRQLVILLSEDAAETGGEKPDLVN